MIGFDLLRPHLLWLGGLALVLAFVGLWGTRRRRAELLRLVSSVQLGRFLPGYSRRRAYLRLALATCALFFLGVSATGPVRGYTYMESSRRGLDLVVCIDTSRSMLAQDLRPSRLERAKREVRGLLEHLKGDRVALIAFSGDAREVAPLTHDRFTLSGLLDFVGPEDNRLGGTDLAAAIEKGLEMFDGRTGAHEAIVLLTDGEDLEGRAVEVARQAADRNIRIYVVGVGTEGGGKIPVVDEQGRESFLRDPDGKEVVSRLSSDGLQAIARTTGGDFLSAENSPTPLEDLYRARISKLPGRDTEGGRRRVPHDRYQWTLVVALACMLAETGLRERTRRAS